jgi:hypothetical protein
MAADGFCTIECGVPGAGGAILPDDGPCQAGYTQTEGVPRCAFADDASNPAHWYCGLFCGAGTAPTDDGPCPYDLRCAFDRADGDAGLEICGE